MEPEKRIRKTEIILYANKHEYHPFKAYLANWRDVLGGAAGSVVASVRQAGEHLGVPGRADHHVGHADPVQLARVAELVEAPGTQRFGC